VFLVSWLGHADQRQFDLQRRRADQAGELRLGLDLLGHQVQQPDAQGADVLPVGRTPAHDHDALVAQDVEGGQGGGQADGHGGLYRFGLGVGLPRRPGGACKGGGHQAVTSAASRTTATSAAVTVMPQFRAIAA
jgi:hypothetical protein